MPADALVAILAIAGALCLALMAAARRWPGEGPWGTRRQERDEAQQRFVRSLMEEFGGKQAQQALQRVLRARFGELPPDVITRIESESPEWCEEMLAQAAVAGSLDELGF